MALFSTKYISDPIDTHTNNIRNNNTEILYWGHFEANLFFEMSPAAPPWSKQTVLELVTTNGTIPTLKRLLRRHLGLWTMKEYIGRRHASIADYCHQTYA